VGGQLGLIDASRGFPVELFGASLRRRQCGFVERSLTSARWSASSWERKVISSAVS